jgi:hypothetical protein
MIKLKTISFSIQHHTSLRREARLKRAKTNAMTTSRPYVRQIRCITEKKEIKEKLNLSYKIYSLIVLDMQKPYMLRPKVGKLL